MQTRPPSRSSQRAKEVSRRVNERPQGCKETWHAVSILTSTTTCEAASALRNHRFLSKDAPKLPLTSCSSPQSCRCIYRHHSDRRSKPRRATDRGEAPRSNGDAERRGRGGRRSDDV